MSIERRLDKIERKAGVKEKWDFTLVVEKEADIEEALKQKRKKLEADGFEPGKPFIIITGEG